MSANFWALYFGLPVEEARLPEMLTPVSWSDVQRFFEQEAQALLRQL